MHDNKQSKIKTILQNGLYESQTHHKGILTITNFQIKNRYILLQTKTTIFFLGRLYAVQSFVISQNRFIERV